MESRFMIQKTQEESWASTLQVTLLSLEFLLALGLELSGSGPQDPHALKISIAEGFCGAEHTSYGGFHSK